MFTGLVSEVGTIQTIKENQEGKYFKVACPKLITEIEINDSISVNGVCLTAVQKSESSFQCQAVHVTLEKTSLGQLEEGSDVNLELAMRLNDRLGGHFVQGHVNTTTQISHIETIGDNWNFKFTTPNNFEKYIVKEGSISIDGTSLTISDHAEDKSWFKVTVIPHTLEHTLFGGYKLDQKVNLEFDMILKYLESLSSSY